MTSQFYFTFGFEGKCENYEVINQIGDDITEKYSVENITEYVKKLGDMVPNFVLSVHRTIGEIFFNVQENKMSIFWLDYQSPEDGDYKEYHTEIDFSVPL